jgi:hypothetical protein
MTPCVPSIAGHGVTGPALTAWRTFACRRGRAGLTAAPACTRCVEPAAWGVSGHLPVAHWQKAAAAKRGTYCCSLVVRTSALPFSRDSSSEALAARWIPSPDAAAAPGMTALQVVRYTGLGGAERGMPERWSKPPILKLQFQIAIVDWPHRYGASRGGVAPRHTPSKSHRARGNHHAGA